MRGEFTNKHDWLTISLALCVWAAHFMLMWSASSIFPGQAAARWAALIITILAFVALRQLRRHRGVSGFRSVEGLGVGIATVAVAYTALPALIG